MTTTHQLTIQQVALLRLGLDKVANDLPTFEDTGMDRLACLASMLADCEGVSIDMPDSEPVLEALSVQEHFDRFTRSIKLPPVPTTPTTLTLIDGGKV